MLNDVLEDRVIEIGVKKKQLLKWYLLQIDYYIGYFGNQR